MRIGVCFSSECVCMCVCGGGVGVIYCTTRVGRQPSFLANLWSSLPACPTLGALPETDGSRNVLEQHSEELLVAQKAREGEGVGCLIFLHKLLPLCSSHEFHSFIYSRSLVKEDECQVYRELKGFSDA